MVYIEEAFNHCHLGTIWAPWSADSINGYCLAGTGHSHYPLSDKFSDAYELGDYATALREWRPLAKQGNASAQFLLGYMYYNGYGVPQDYSTAHKWYSLAALPNKDLPRPNPVWRSV